MICKIIKLYCNLLNMVITNRAVFSTYLHISCKQIKPENKNMGVLHFLTLFLSSGLIRFTTSAYATHVVGGKNNEEFCCAVISVFEKMEVTSSAQNGDESQVLALC